MRWMGEVALEDEIAAVLDLVDGVEPVQIHRAPLPFGELRAQQQRPVVQALADHLTGEPDRQPLAGPRHRRRPGTHCHFCGSRFCPASIPVR